jgi:predicted glutamine amidotransferase
MLTNPHGTGVSWVNQDGSLEYEKGLQTPEQVFELSQSKPLPQIIHMRIASVGTSDGLDGKLLTHPFEVTKKSQLRLKGKLKKGSMLFTHNGTITKYEDMLTDAVIFGNNKMLKGAISDSRVMAFCVANYGHEFIPHLDKDNYNKYAVLTSDGIIKYGNFHDESESEKIQASNNYHHSYSNNGYVYGTSIFSEYNDDDFVSKQNQNDFDVDKFGDSNKPYQQKQNDLECETWCNRKSAPRSSHAVDPLNDVEYSRDGKWFLPAGQEYWEKCPDGFLTNKQKRMIKKERKQNIKYLKKSGWIRPNDLSNENLRAHVQYEKQNQKTIDAINKTKSDIADEKNRITPRIKYLDYEDMYYNELNEKWIENCNNLTNFNT